MQVWIAVVRPEIEYTIKKNKKIQLLINHQLWLKLFWTGVSEASLSPHSPPLSSTLPLIHPSSRWHPSEQNPAPFVSGCLFVRLPADRACSLQQHWQQQHHVCSTVTMSWQQHTAILLLFMHSSINPSVYLLPQRGAVIKRWNVNELICFCLNKGHEGLVVCVWVGSGYNI